MVSSRSLRCSSTCVAGAGSGEGEREREGLRTVERAAWRSVRGFDWIVGGWLVF